MSYLMHMPNPFYKVKSEELEKKMNYKFFGPYIGFYGFSNNSLIIFKTAYGHHRDIQKRFVIRS